MFHRHTLSTLLAVSLICVSTNGQNRFAIQVAIDGVEIRAELQPRVVIEQQRSGGEVRIELRGLAAMEYAATISQGDAVDIAAVAIDGDSTRFFHGFVSTIVQGSDGTQPVVEITASGPAVFSASGAVVRLGGDSGTGVLAFAPRLSSSFSVQEVVVRGVDESGAPLTARALAPTIPLDGAPAATFGTQLLVESDRVFSSQADADAFALATLDALLIDRVSGEAVIEGRPDLRMGSFVEIEGIDAEFDGAYYVTGVSHRLGPDSYGGFSTTLRVRRADRGMFRLPGIDDEVLVAFEHGDLNQPYVVDSWWNCDSRPRPSSSDGNDQCRYLRWPW